MEFTELPNPPRQQLFSTHIPEDHIGANVTHAIAIQLKSPSDMHPLTRSAIEQLYADFKELTETLSLEMSWEDEMSAYGRFSADIVDHVDVEALKLSEDHFVCAMPAEEPGEGTWTNDWDIHIDHPERCTLELQERGECPWAYEIYSWGAEGFGDIEEWGTPPFRVRGRYKFYHYPSTPDGPEEWDLEITPDHEGKTDAEVSHQLAGDLGG